MTVQLHTYVNRTTKRGYIVKILGIIREIIESLITDGAKEFIKGFISSISPKTYATIIGCLMIAVLWLLSERIKRNNIMHRIRIGNKEYYDILDDVWYFRKGSTRNKFPIEEFKWDMNLKRRTDDPILLDLHAKWTIKFKAGFVPVRQVNVGIRGGCLWKDDHPKQILAWQDGRRLRISSNNNQDDYGTVLLPLNTHIPANETGEVQIQYTNQKFMIADPDFCDDYFYIFPIAHAQKIDKLLLNFTHPYKCRIRLLLLHRNELVHTYEQTELLDDDRSHGKHNFQCENMNEFKENHTLKFFDIEPFDVLVIVFDQDDGH